MATLLGPLEITAELIPRPGGRPQNLYGRRTSTFILQLVRV